MIGFSRFNALHQGILSANFDSVHGARTLLKARFLIDQAARDLESGATLSPERQKVLFESADKRLLNAEKLHGGRPRQQSGGTRQAGRARSARRGRACSASLPATVLSSSPPTAAR